MWGQYVNISGDPARDVMNIPDEVKNSKVVHVAAGSDHCVAITDDGRVIAWGEYDNGQYGHDGSMIAAARKQPEELMDGGTQGVAGGRDVHHLPIPDVLEQVRADAAPVFVRYADDIVLGALAADEIAVLVDAVDAVIGKGELHEGALLLAVLDYGGEVGGAQSVIAPGVDGSRRGRMPSRSPAAPGISC